MKILKNSVVTIDYSTADIEGTVVDEGAQPITYLHGGYEMGLFPKIFPHYAHCINCIYKNLRIRFENVISNIDYHVRLLDFIFKSIAQKILQISFFGNMVSRRLKFCKQQNFYRMRITPA